MGQKNSTQGFMNVDSMINASVYNTVLDVIFKMHGFKCVKEGFPCAHFNALSEDKVHKLEARKDDLTCKVITTKDFKRRKVIVDRQLQNVVAPPARTYVVRRAATDYTRILMLIDGENQVYVYSWSKDLYQIYGLKFPTRMDLTQHVQHTLLDGHMLKPDSIHPRHRFIIYDMVFSNGVLVRDEPLTTRLERIKHEIIYPRWASINQGLIDARQEPLDIYYEDISDMGKVRQYLLGQYVGPGARFTVGGFLFQPLEEAYLAGPRPNWLEWRDPEQADLKGSSAYVMAEPSEYAISYEFQAAAIPVISNTRMVYAETQSLLSAAAPLDKCTLCNTPIGFYVTGVCMHPCCLKCSVQIRKRGLNWQTQQFGFNDKCPKWLCQLPNPDVVVSTLPPVPENVLQTLNKLDPSINRFKGFCFADFVASRVVTTITKQNSLRKIRKRWF